MISQRMGRVLSALGAVLLLAGLFVTWYHVQRAGGFVEPATGWETFTRLRILILAGAIVLLLSAVVAQTEPVLVVRTVVGAVLGVLILRRIVFPPEIAAPVSSQAGVFVGLAGALAAVLGGLVDSGREVAQRYPDVAFWRPSAGELGVGGPPPRSDRFGPGGDSSNGAVVDSTAEEI